ncbi:hypothetical protein, partial [Allofournierella sp.]|uniref:hypothetical protein n=1 Tax=Allofournierella sp. TaxID=1940256 RepID=UPI003AF74E17
MAAWAAPPFVGGKQAGMCEFACRDFFKTGFYILSITRAAEKEKPTRTKRIGFSWSCYPDLNWRPHPYQGCALP